jgi:CHASE1-domain containing sensor protein
VSGINLLFCSHLNGAVVFNVGEFHLRWLYFNLPNPTFQTHKEKNMSIIFAGLLIVGIPALVTLLARRKRASQENKVVDERLYRCTH